jgi:hypothetical protein
MNKWWLAPENEGKHWTVVAKRGDVILGFGHYVVDERVEAAEAEEKPGLPSFPEGTDVEAAKYLFEVIGNSEKGIKGKYVSESAFQRSSDILGAQLIPGLVAFQCSINSLLILRIRRLVLGELFCSGVLI